MLVRILKPAEGIMDGVSLAHLVTSVTYDVEPSVARYLIQTRHAAAVSPSEPTLVIPLDNARAYLQLTGGVTIVLPLAEAADRPSRRRSNKKR